MKWTITHLSQHSIGYMTAIIESCGILKFLETRQLDIHRVPVAVIELRHKRLEMLEKVKRILGMRQSITPKKRSNYYMLRLSEQVAFELLTVITPVGLERRRQIFLELVRYKRLHDIQFGNKNVPITLEQQKHLDGLVQKLNCRSET